MRGRNKQQKEKEKKKKKKKKEDDDDDDDKGRERKEKIGRKTTNEMPGLLGMEEEEEERKKRGNGFLMWPSTARARPFPFASPISHCSSSLLRLFLFFPKNLFLPFSQSRPVITSKYRPLLTGSLQILRSSLGHHQTGLYVTSAVAIKLTREPPPPLTAAAIDYKWR